MTSPAQQTRIDRILDAWARRVAPAPTPCPRGPLRSVCVVGAGIAGVAAARLLQRHTRLDVRIIEARDRVGGRLWTLRWDTPGAGACPIDLGASWIHGTRDNPIAQLVEATGGRYERTRWSRSALFTPDGRRMTDVESRRTLAAQSDLLDALADHHARHPQARQASVSDALAALALDPSPEAARVYAWALEVLAQIEGADVDTLSLAHLHGDDEDDQDDGLDDGGNALLDQGYGPLIQALAAPLSVQLNAPLRALAHTPDAVQLTLEDGTTHDTDCALLTLPLGVLQADRVRFTPPLPARTRAAIAGLGSGLLNKIALRFDRTFWPINAYMIARIHAPNPFATILNLRPLTGEPILVAFAAGTHARWLEGASDATLVRAVMHELRICFGPDTPDPIDARITRWGRDPFARGAYSHLPAGASPDLYAQLGEPVGPRVLMAGEATAAHHNATAHGALLSGLREAQRVLAWLPEALRRAP